MRIAHIVCTYPPYFGGMGNVTFHLVEELITRGHDVDVFTPGYYKSKEVRPAEAPSAAVHEPILEEEIDHVKRVAPTLQYGNAARLPTLKHELDAYDLVHLHYPFFGTASVVRKWKERSKHIPLVVTYHMDAHAHGWLGLIFNLYARFWMPRILQAADHLIASSSGFIASSQAQQLYKKEKSRWSIIPFGVDTERFFPDSHAHQLRKELEIPMQAPVLLFVGGMDKAHHFKGIPILLKALTLLRKLDAIPQVVLVGDGDLREQYMLQAQGMGLSAYVQFVGRVSDEELPAYYKMADLFVLPSTSRAEAFGLVLLEAMASGTPVLASDLPGVESVARDGGEVFPVRDYAALADAIMEFFLLSKEQRAQRGDEAAQHVQEKYSWSAVAKRHEELYRSLVEEGAV